MKRFLDLVLVFLLLPLILLMCSIIALFVKINLGSPVFFVQARPGLSGNIFNMLKFRTMAFKFDADNHLLPDSARLNKFGKFLRSTSLDELPSFWNVINGSMSLVGPRPLLVEYLPLYNKRQASRHNVKPGITGWAQVNGRNTISWEEKFRLDVEYVETQSFWLDMKIIAMTIKNVIQRKGISSDDHATMEEFMGKE